MGYILKIVDEGKDVKDPTLAPYEFSLILTKNTLKEKSSGVGTGNIAHGITGGIPLVLEYNVTPSGTSDTGWRVPTATGLIKNEWVNPTNAYVSDDAYTYPVDGGVSFFARLLKVRISFDDGDTFSIWSGREFQFTTGVDQIKSSGSSTYLWGLTATEATAGLTHFLVQIENCEEYQDYYGFNFEAEGMVTGIVIEVEAHRYTNPFVWDGIYLDRIRAKIYYDPNVAHAASGAEVDATNMVLGASNRFYRIFYNKQAV